MSRITHSLVGYDRLSQRVAEEFDVPAAVLPLAKELARVPDNDPDAVMCYPLEAARAQDLADMLKARIDTGQRDYFFEGFAGAQEAYEFAVDAAFRSDFPEWSVWIHNDGKKDHIKVTVAGTTLEEYAVKHGERDYRTVPDLLNAKIRHQVGQVVNRAIADGRVNSRAGKEGHTFGRIDLQCGDLDTILSGCDSK